MKIHEVMAITGLTKKAINYYTQQGLISPFVDVDNNYRNFDSEDVVRLTQISALREFDMSVKEIKDAFLSKENFIKALNLYSHKLKDRIVNMKQCENILNLCLNEVETEFPDMEKITDNMIFLKKSLILTEKGREDFVCKELQRIFPGSFGKIISLKLCYFLQDITLDEMDKQSAWLQMVDQLDQCSDLSFDKKFEDFIESENINWKKIEQLYIERMEKDNGQKIQDIMENMWNFSDYNLTDEEMNIYEIEFHFLQSKENIKCINDVFLRISDNLEILSPKYKKYQNMMKEINKTVGENLKKIKKSGDKPDQDIQIVNLPEMKFIGIETKKILSFEEVYQLVVSFSEKIKGEQSFRNADDIFVIKGIGSLPQYRAIDADHFKFKFSLIVAMQVTNTDSIPDGMKAFTIPSHSYIKYITKVDASLKNFIDDESPIISSITQQYKPSIFPLLERYHVSDMSFVENFMPIGS